MRPISIESPRAFLFGALFIAAAAAVLLLLSPSEKARGQTPGCEEAPAAAAEPTPRCLIIEKQTDPDGSTLNFNFDVTVDPPAAPAVNDTQILEDDESFGIPLGLQNTPSGTVITVTEDVPTGWSLNVSCEGDGIAVAQLADGVQVTYTGTLNEGEPFAYGICVFTNEDERTPTPTATATATPTTTVTTTTTPTATPTFFYGPNDQPNVGGIFQPNPARTPTPRATAVPQTTSPVRPPSTGDGGLR